jgi:autotransporter-associated beta strand protein
VFEGTAGTITLSAPTAHNLNFNSGTYALQSSTLTLNGTTPTITVNPNLSASISSIVAGTAGLTKSGAGTLTLSGANTFTGTTTISNGTLKIDAGAGGSLSGNALTFSGTGTFNYDNTTASGSKSQSLGALTASAGEGTVQLTRTASQSVSLTFSSLASRAAGAALNLVKSGTPGVNGTDSSISISGTAAGLLNKGVFFNGADYAYANTAGGYVRAPVYGTDSGFASVTTLAGNSGTHNLLTTSSSFSDGSFFKSTKISSPGTVDITISGTTWYWSGTGNGGLLRTGGGSTAINGPGVLKPASAGELVFRADTTSDTVVVNAVIADNGTTALTKCGAGTLTLNATNTFSGATTVDAGTLLVNGIVGTNNAVNGVTVQNTGTLGGSGTVNGPVTVNAGGTIQPSVSGSTNTLTLASATAPTLNAGATIKVRVPAINSADQVYLSSATPTFNCANVNLVIDTTGLNGNVTGATIVRTANSAGINSVFASTNVIGTYAATLHYNANSITVDLVSPPHLAITSVNGGSSPAAGTPFAVTVQAQSGTGAPMNVVSDTAVALSLNTGSGTLGGTLTGTIFAGNNSVTISGVTYTKAESNVTFTATRTSGDTFAAGNSAPFAVTAGAAASIALTSGNNQSQNLLTPLASPFVVTVTDANANPVSGVSVVVAVASAPASATGQSLSITNATTGANGQASSVLTVGDQNGAYTVTATSGGLTGSPITFTATGAVIPPTKLAITSVNGGTNPVAGSPFSVVVQSQDAGGVPRNVLADTALTLSLNTGGGILGGTLTGTISNGNSSAILSGVTYTKAESGVVLTVSTNSGMSLTAANSAAFTVNAGAAANFTLTSGNNQSGLTASNLASPFVVTVTDANANPVAGVSVVFAVSAAPVGATGQKVSVTNATTAANGQASSTLTLGSLGGAYAVTATSGTLSGSPATFNASAVQAWDGKTCFYDASTAAADGAQDGAGAGWNTTATNFWTDTKDIVWPNATTSVAVFGAGNGTAGTVNVGTVNANGIQFNAPGSGSYALTNGTITLAGTTPFVSATNNVSGAIASTLAGTAGLAKIGRGTVTLSGANNFTGLTTVSNGTLTLDYSSQDNSKLADASALTLAGGTLNLNGGTHTEIVSGTTLSPTASRVTRTGGAATLQMAAIAQSSGGTLDFGASGIATANTANNANGILGGWATIAGTDWAATAASANNTPVAALASYYSTAAGGNTPSNYAAKNVDVVSSPTVGAMTPNTLRFNSAAANVVTLTGNCTLGGNASSTPGGVLVTPNVGNNVSRIAGTGLLGCYSFASTYVYLQQWNTANVLQIDCPLNDSTAMFVKTGPGTVVLNGGTPSTYNYFNGFFINQGAVLFNTNSYYHGPLTVRNGGVMGGNGTYMDAVTVNAGGTIQPSLSGGTNTLTLASATAPAFSAGAVLKVRVPTPTAADKVYLSSGTPVFNCANLDLVIDTTGLAANATNLTIVQTANGSGVTGAFRSVSVTANFNATLHYNGNSVTVDLIGIPPTQLAVTQINGGFPPSAGAPFSVVVESQDATGTPRFGSTATNVVLQLATGSGTLAGTLTGVIPAGSSSVTISGATYDTAQAGVSVRAVNTGGSLATGTSAPFVVNPAADHFVISGIATLQTAGTPITGFTITAQDAGNNTLTSFYGTVTFGGTAGGTGTSPQFTAGVCTTATVTPLAAGTNLTITVSDALGHTGSTLITSLYPGPVNQFWILPATIATATAGAPLTVGSIVPVDANGKYCNYGPNTFNGTVTFGGTAGATGSISFTGVLNNASVTPTSAGSGKTITVDDGAGHTGSATITTVFAGAPAALAKTSGDNQSGLASAGLPNPLVVTVTDAYGNPVGGTNVNFTASGGSVNPSVVATDTNGQAAAYFTLGSSLGGYTVTASLGALTPVTFAATANPPLSNILTNDAGFESASPYVYPGFPNNNGTGGSPGTYTSVAGWVLTFTGPDSGSGTHPPAPPVNRGYIVTTPSETVAQGRQALGLSCTMLCTLETLPASRPAVQPNTQYGFKFAMHYSGRDQFAGMIWYDFAGNVIKRSTNQFRIPVTSESSGWGYSYLYDTSPANAATVSAYFQFNSGFVELDDFYISTKLPPTVNAGSGRSILVGDTVTLAATATEPDGSPLTFSWSRIGGPNTLVISNANTLTPTVSGFNAATNYTLLLTVSDGANLVTNAIVITAVDPSGNLLVNDAGFEQCGTLYPSARTAGYTDTTMPGWIEYWAEADSGVRNTLPLNQAWAPSATYEPPMPAGSTFGWGVSATGPYWLETAPANRAPVRPGQLYTLSFYTRWAMHSQYQAIRWYDINGNFISQTTNAAYGDGYHNTWTWFYFNGVAPANAASASAYYYGLGDTTFSKGQNKYVPGYVELDSFELRTNNPPVISAGPAQAGFTNTYALAATAYSPNGSPLQFSWTQVSGPGTATFGNAVSTNSTVTLSAPGIYTLKLSVGDGIYVVSSTVNINYIGDYYGNLLGANYSFEDPSAPIYIESTGQTDSSIPGWIVTFTVPTVNPLMGNNVGLMNITTAANGAAADGTNALYMDCYAGGSVTIETSPSARAPIVEPGQVYQLQFAQSLVPNDAAPGIKWYDAAGNFISSNSFTPSGTSYPLFVATQKKFAAPTNAAWAGIYYFMDGGFNMVDNFSISRQTNNEPPTVHAGVEMTRAQGVPVMLAGAANDPDPLDVLSVSWTQISGPGTVTFANPNSARSAATFGALGDYVLQLTVDDQTGMPGHVVSSQVLVHIVAPTGEKVLVFAGQSNMEGHGTANTLANLPPYLSTNIPNVYGFYANEMDWIGGSPEMQGEQIYNHLNVWASMKTNIVFSGTTNRYFIAGGTYQPYSFWLGSWTGYSRTSPGDPTRAPFNIVKGTTSLNYWAAGFNPGEPFANANTFSSGEPVQEYGPELTALWTIHTNNPAQTYYVVKYAPGGTSLASDWNPARPDGRYVGMKDWIEAALAERPGAELGGFFWLQGESDCGNGASYYQNLTNLIATVRADYGVTNLPFIIAKISPGNPQDPGSNPSLWTNSNYGVVWYGSTNGIYAVRKAQGDAATNDANVKTIETSDLNLLTSEWHQAQVHNKSLVGTIAGNAAVLFNVVTNTGWSPVHFDDASIRTIGNRMGLAFIGQPFNSASVTLASSAPYSPVGLPVSFTATLMFNGATAADATGTVVFATNGIAFYTNNVVGGVVTSVALTNLPIGSASITATYSGDSKYIGNSGALTQLIAGPPVDYFVSTSGNDANAGTSWAQPFRHIAAATAIVTPGSTIHLQAGQTFNEAVVFTNGGVRGYPITLMCDDPATRATVTQVSGNDGIHIKDCGYITLRNLVLTGLGTNANLWNNSVHGGNVSPPNGVHAQALAGRYGGINVSNLTVTGFWRGVQISGELVPPSHGYGYYDCVVEDSQFNHNTDAGGIAFGVYDSPPCISNMVVRRCEFNYNLGDWVRQANSGSGFVFGETIDGLIEYCIAHDNGGRSAFHAGPVGLWCYDSRRITIQYCESYRNQAQQQDGDGFDLDVGTFDSVIQYCYSHDNFGAAFLIEPWDIATSNCIVRYCVSENDGQGGLMGAINFMALGTHGKYLSDIQIYNNTIYSSVAPLIYNYGLELCERVTFRNNIFIVTNNQPFLAYTATASGPTTNQFLFQGNCYWSYNGPFNMHGYTSFTNWQSSLGQELLNGTNVGVLVNPMVKNAGYGGTIGNTFAFTNLTAYQLQTNSPMINAGLNLPAIFGADVGAVDLFGVAIPQGGSYDIGASEFVSPLVVVTVPTTITLTSSTNPSVFGQPVTFTAMVTPASGIIAPMGTVQFKADGVLLGSPVTVTNAVGVNSLAAITTASIAAAGSPHVIAAEFSGTGIFLNSTNTLPGGHTVNHATPVISGLTATPGSGFGMTFSGPAGQTYQVLSSTNVALPMASWTPVASGTFSGSSVTYTSAFTAPSCFYRVVSP